MSDSPKVMVMLDERILALVHEVQLHPDLIARMKEAEIEGAKAHSTIFTTPSGHDDIPVIQSFEQAIGFLAAEVGIALHGDYTHDDLCKLCMSIREDLIQRRAVIINSVGEIKAESKIIIPTGYKH